VALSPAGEAVTKLFAVPMKIKKTMWYFGQELTFRKEADSIDEAQALLDYEHRQGRIAWWTHKNGKHQIYIKDV